MNDPFLKCYSFACGQPVWFRIIDPCLAIIFEIGILLNWVRVSEELPIDIIWGEIDVYRLLEFYENSFRHQKRSQPPTNNGPPSTGAESWESTCIKCLVDRISRNDLSLTTNHKDNNIKLLGWIMDKLLIFTALHLTFSFFWRSESLCCCCYSFLLCPFTELEREKRW